MKKLVTWSQSARHGRVGPQSVGIAVLLVSGLMLPIWPLSTAVAAAEPWVSMDWNVGGSYRNVAFSVTATGSGLKISAGENLPWGGAYGCTIPTDTLVFDLTLVGKDSAGNNLYTGIGLGWTAGGGICSTTGLGGQWSAVLKPGQNGFLTPKLEYGINNVIGVFLGTYKSGDSMPSGADYVFYRKGGTTTTPTPTHTASQSPTPTSHPSSAKTITTCTNIKTGINRLLTKGTCTLKIEKNTSWVRAGTTKPAHALTTCTNIKTGINRLLSKGTCKTKIEKKTFWVKAVVKSTPRPTPTPITTSPAAFSYKVGDPGPGGGLIFFVDANDAYPGFTYLEAAPLSCESTRTWSSDVTHSNSSAKGNLIGNGQSNTTAMMTNSAAYLADKSGAAFYADTLSCGGKSDWFLGSIGELVAVFNKLPAPHGLTTVAYWTSTEGAADGAWFITYNPGSQDIGNKSSTAYVRPIRAF